MIKKKVSHNGILKKCLIHFLFIVFSLVPVVAGATDYTVYVDADVPDNHVASATPDCTNYDRVSGSCVSGSYSVYKTIQDVNAFIKTLGWDDKAAIYFQRGDTWVIHTGSAVLNVSKENITISAFGSGDRPIFDGNNMTKFGEGRTQPLVQVSAAGAVIEYVTIQNAHGSGIRFDQTVNGILRHSKIDMMGNAAVEVARSDNITVEQCEISRAGYYHNQGPEPIYAYHPQAINANGNLTDNCTFRYNYIYNTWTEGIAANSHTVEYNIIGASTSSGIYAGRRGNGTVIRYNLVFGTSDSTYHKHSLNGRQWNGPGIGIDEEDASQDPSGSQIYGNIVIGRYAGFRIKNYQHILGTDVEIYQNTFIDNGYSFYISEPTYWEISLRNNLSVVYDTKYSKHVVCYGDESNWIIGSNHWSSMPQDADWHDVGQDRISDPKLPKDSGWTTLVGRANLSLADFYPNSSPVLDNSLKEHHTKIFDKVLKRHGTWDIHHDFRVR